MRHAARWAILTNGAQEPAAVSREKQRAALRLRQHTHLPTRMSRQLDQQQRAIVEQIIGRAQPRQSRAREARQLAQTPRKIFRQERRNEAAPQSIKAMTGRDVGISLLRSDKSGRREIAQTGNMIGVKV